MENFYSVQLWSIKKRKWCEKLWTVSEEQANKHYEKYVNNMPKSSDAAQIILNNTYRIVSTLD